jgi:RNA polymerase sigma-B factor
LPHSAEVERKQLIESHLALVRAVARRYVGRGETLDDLVQVGAIGLIKATDRFDPSRGVAFSTFATPFIEGAIRHHLRDRVSSLRIPRDLQRKSGNLHRRSGELAASLGRSPTTRELATALDTDERDVERVLGAARARELIPISVGDDRGELPDESAGLADSETRLLLEGSLRTLDERERRIVLLRFHADMTEREIAREVGISQAQVSRVLSGALAKLRTDLSSSKDHRATGDITSNTEISPGSAPSSTGDAPRRSRSRKPTRRGHSRPATKIAPVEASEQSGTLKHYLELPYRVAVKSELEGEEQSWSATVVELAGCSARGATPDEAVKRLRPAMEAWLTEALAERREIPLPRAASKGKPSSSHSGRFLVRMPGELHEQLAHAAEEREVSLNRFVTDVLAASVSASRLSDALPRSQGPIAPVEGDAVGPEAHELVAPVEPEAAGPVEPQAVARETHELVARETHELVARETHELVAFKVPEPVASADPGTTPQRHSPRALRVALAANVAVVVAAAAVAVVLLVLALKHGI